MTSLILGIACLYFAWTILRMPEDQFCRELDEITGRGHGQGYYTLLRWLVRALGLLGAAMILLRFFNPTCVKSSFIKIPCAKRPCAKIPCAKAGQAGPQKIAGRPLALPCRPLF